MVNYLFHTHDPRLYEIILHRTRYYHHIWMQHGIDVESILSVVEAPDLFLKVCVLFKQDVGRVLTAFDVEAPKQTEEILWQK